MAISLISNLNKAISSKKIKLDPTQMELVRMARKEKNQTVQCVLVYHLITWKYGICSLIYDLVQYYIDEHDIKSSFYQLNREVMDALRNCSREIDSLIMKVENHMTAVPGRTIVADANACHVDLTEITLDMILSMDVDDASTEYLIIHMHKIEQGLFHLLDVTFRLA